MTLSSSTRYEKSLKCSPVFSGLDDNVLKDMLKAFRAETWKKGICGLLKDTTKRFHVLVSGRLEITRTHPDTGRSVTLWLLGPGDVFDIVTLLDGRPHGVIPVALEDAKILFTSLPMARQWINTYPRFGRNLLPYIGERFRHIENFAADLAIHDTMTRLARLILRHVDPEHPMAKDNPHALKLINDLPHEALARMVGSVRVVINRHLQHWKKHSIIDYQRGNLVVKDLEALAAWCKDLPGGTKYRGSRHEGHL